MCGPGDPVGEADADGDAEGDGVGLTGWKTPIRIGPLPVPGVAVGLKTATSMLGNTIGTVSPFIVSSISLPECIMLSVIWPTISVPTLTPSIVPGGRLT